MRVVLEVDGGEVDVEVAVHDPAATATHLVVALDATTSPGSLVIDGRQVPAAAPLASCGLRPGCTIRVGSAGEAPRAAAPNRVTELLVVGGLAAGGRHPLGPGCSMIGRNAVCDAVLPARTASGHHAAVFVEAPEAVVLADAGSSGGTWADGHPIGAAERLTPDVVVAMGACLLRVEPPAWCEPAVLGRRDGDGRRPLHRPPPAVCPPSPPPVTPPSSDPPPAERPRFGWAAALVPLVGGLVLARLVDPRLALFTLLGPAVLIGQWLEDKRRHRRRQADAGVAQRAGLGAFVGDVSTAAATESRRQRMLHPDPAVLGVQIDGLGSGLWSRRPSHPSFVTVAVGAAPALAWAPPLTKPVEGTATAALAASRLPPGSPATVELAPACHIGISGSRAAALAVARWVVLQLAAHHGPADLRLAVVCRPERVAAWSWVAFLPHVAPARAGGRLLLATDVHQARHLAEVHSAAGDGVRLVVVVDGDGLVDVNGPAASLFGGEAFGGEATTLTIGPSRRALPGRCSSVLELDGPDGWGQLASGDRPPQAVLATGIDIALARRWARRLAQLSDPEEASGGAVPPGASRLLDLLGFHDPGPGDILHRWAQRRGPVTPIGSTGGPDGVCPVELDLVGDGPHALVAGTTGAGKSELLRSLVAGLAASVSPDRLAMLLVDYKGGAAFAEAARLPHVVGVVTDLGPDEAARAIHSLEAELRRREGVLAELGLRDLVEHPAHGPGPRPEGCEPLPRLVVVIDELATLVAELPSFLDDLVQLAARGRSLGLHLVLATQRPGSVVSAAVRTNCAIRCCLRVPEEADAVDVVGSPAPARLDRRQAGRAFLRRGAGDLLEVQVALAGGPRPEAPPSVSVRPAVFGPGPDDDAEAAGEGISDLAALVEACRAAATQAGHARPRPLWLPPLPDHLPASDLPDLPDAPDALGALGALGAPNRADSDPSSRTLPAQGAMLGLLDDPARQRRLPLTWHPDRGPLVALGRGPGPADALEAAARVLAARHDPTRLHVYVLDLGAQGLAPLADLPHVAALVRAGEHERLHRLVDRLAADLAGRQAAVAGAAIGDRHGGRPAVLLLIDGAGALRSAFEGSRGLAALDLLERVVVDGAALGLVTAVTADRLAAVPGAWLAAASARLVFGGGDPLDLLAVGAARVDRSAWPDGRCLDLGSGLVAQVATGGWPVPQPLRCDDSGGPAPVGTLPRQVALSTVLGACPSGFGADGLSLTLGIDGLTLDPAAVALRSGQPLLVCGLPGSGRSTTLAGLAASAGAAGCQVADAADGLGERLARHRAGPAAHRPLVIVVDDADRVPDPDGALAELAAGRVPGVHLLASAPPDAVRSAFGHWSAGLRRATTGLVLRPRSELDADVLGVPVLPRWFVPLGSPGRAVLVVEGDARPVQVAVP